MVLYPSTSLHHVTPVTAGRAGRVVLLDPEPDSRRRAAGAAVRHGHGDPAARARRSGSSLVGATHRRVSQPAAAVGGAVGRLERIRRFERFSSGSTSPPALSPGRHPDHVGHGDAAHVSAVHAEDDRARSQRRHAPGRRRSAARPSTSCCERARAASARRAAGDAHARLRSHRRRGRGARHGRHGLRESLYGTGARVRLSQGPRLLPIGHELASLAGRRG